MCQGISNIIFKRGIKVEYGQKLVEINKDG
jgi:hypothetical protein